MNKVLTRIALRRRLDVLRRRGKRIVFTNGCFDLIHPGHVRYLRSGKAARGCAGRGVEQRRLRAAPQGAGCGRSCHCAIAAR